MMNIIIFIFGIIFGSFFNAVVYRVPLEISISKGRSICPSCKHSLNAFDLVPVFSWLFLGRKCRYCHGKIPARYPLVELITGVVFLFAYYYFGYNWNLLIYLSFYSMLLITTLIDYDHMIVSDGVLIICSAISFVGILLSKSPILYHLTGALVGFLIYLVVYLVSMAFYKKEAFGFGDVLLITAIGLVLGMKNTILTAFLAFYVALVFIVIMRFVGKKFKAKQEVPFGPYICIAAFIVSIYGETMMEWYTKFIQ